MKSIKTTIAAVATLASTIAFGGGLYIVAEELLAVDAHGFDALAVDGDVAFLIYLHAVQFLQ